MSESISFRCRRDEYCSARQSVKDPVTGDHLAWVGAEIPEVDGLCKRCVSDVDEALIHLPLDVAEITAQLGKSLGSGYDEQQIAHAKPGPTLPILADREALRALIVHETTSWAVAIGRELGQELDAFQVAHSRLGFRVKVACMVLRANLPLLLAMPPTEYRARSLGVQRTDGHDPNVATRYGDDYWTTRDGIEAGLLLLRLHEQAWAMARRHTAPMPIFSKCPACTQFALRRFPGEDFARCLVCRHKASRESLDVLRAAAGRCVTAEDRATLASIFAPKAAS